MVAMENLWWQRKQDILGLPIGLKTILLTLQVSESLLIGEEGKKHSWNFFREIDFIHVFQQRNYQNYAMIYVVDLICREARLRCRCVFSLIRLLTYRLLSISTVSREFGKISLEKNRNKFYLFLWIHYVQRYSTTHIKYLYILFYIQMVC